MGAAVAARLREAGHELVDVSGRAPPRRPATGPARPSTVASTRSPSAVVTGWSTSGSACAPARTCRWPSSPPGPATTSPAELGLPVHDAAAAARLIDTGRVRSIDAGRAEDDHGVVRWWVGVLGAGFDARVNERANGWSWPTGRWRYVLAVARELPVFRPIPYVVEVDGQRRETGAMLVAVANGPSYGGGMRVCPDAVLDDGLLDVLVLLGDLDAGLPARVPTGVRRHARTAPGGRGRCADGGSGWRPRASSPTPTASASARCRSPARWCRARCGSSSPPDVA